MSLFAKFVVEIDCPRNLDDAGVLEALDQLEELDLKDMLKAVIKQKLAEKPLLESMVVTVEE